MILTAGLTLNQSAVLIDGVHINSIGCRIIENKVLGAARRFYNERKLIHTPYTVRR